MADYTISGIGYHPDGVTPLLGRWVVRINTSNGVLLEDARWRGGTYTEATRTDGSLTMTLPATTGGNYYTAEFLSDDWAPAIGRGFRLPPTPFTLTANRTWSQVIETPYVVPVTPADVTLASQAKLAAESAATSAAGSSSSAAGSASSAASSASAAAAQVAAIPPNNDTIIVGRINDTTSSTRTKLDQLYAAPAAPAPATSDADVAGFVNNTASATRAKLDQLYQTIASLRSTITGMSGGVGPNLITNPSATVDTAGWTSTATLTRDASGFGPAGSFKMVTAAAAAANSGYAYPTPQVDAVPGDYTLEFMVYGTGSTYIQLYAGNGVAFATSATQALTASWTKITLTGTAPAGTTKMYPIIRQATAGAQTLYFDVVNMASSTSWLHSADVPPLVKADVQRRLGGMFNVIEYGADPTGQADSTAAINAASTAAANAYQAGTDVSSVIHMPPGVYKTNGTVWFKSYVDARGATIRSSVIASGTAAVQLLSPTGLTGGVRYGSQGPFFMPSVIATGVNAYTSGSIGILLVNLNTCEVHLPWIEGFSTGLYLQGVEQGVAYNTFHLGAIWVCRTHLEMSANTGWVNANTFIGGRMQPQLRDATHPEDVAATFIRMTAGINNAQPTNQNTWIGTTFEGDATAQYRIQVEGRFNRWINCRFEAFTGESRIRYGDTASKNVIDGGYGVENLTKWGPSAAVATNKHFVPWA